MNQPDDSIASKLASEETTSASRGRTLKGTLGVWSIVFTVSAFAAPLLVVVGLMPSVVAFAGYAIVPAYTLVSLILLLFSVGYATATRYIDRPGGFYAYIAAGLGRTIGLGGGFIAILGYLALMLTTWIALGVYARQLITVTFGGPDIPWYVWSAVGVIITAILGYLKVELSARVLGVAMLLEVGLVLAFDAAVFFADGPQGVPAQAFSLPDLGESGFGLALLFGVLCFIGFESAALYREEAKDPEKTIPRATYASVIIIGIFYIAAAVAILTALGSDGIAELAQANLATVFGELAAEYLGGAIPNVINVLVVTSTYAALLASHNALSRYAYSFGRDHVLPAKLGAVHSRFASPYIASTAISIVSLATVIVLAGLTGFEVAGDDAFTIYVRGNGVAAIVIVFLICLVSLALIAYFAKNKTDMPARVWRTAIAPILGMIGLVVIFILSIVNADSLIGAGPNVSLGLLLVIPIVFFGGVAYALYLKRNRPEIFAKIGRQLETTGESRKGTLSDVE